MKFTATAATLALFAASDVIATGPPFTINTRTENGQDFGPVAASKSNLYVHYRNADAKCARPGSGYAFFEWDAQEQRLLMYSTATDKQVVFVDRSGMGQGKIGYLTGQPPPRFETTGWTINNNGRLTFKNAGLLVCPPQGSAAPSLWLDIGIPNPGGNKDCIKLQALVSPSQNANPCQYS